MRMSVWSGVKITQRCPVWLLMYLQVCLSQSRKLTLERAYDFFSWCFSLVTFLNHLLESTVMIKIMIHERITAQAED